MPIKLAWDGPNAPDRFGVYSWEPILFQGSLHHGHIKVKDGKIVDSERTPEDVIKKLEEQGLNAEIEEAKVRYPISQSDPVDKNRFMWNWDPK